MKPKKRCTWGSKSTLSLHTTLVTALVLQVGQVKRPSCTERIHAVTAEMGILPHNTRLGAVKVRFPKGNRCSGWSKWRLGGAGACQVVFVLLDPRATQPTRTSTVSTHFVPYCPVLLVSIWTSSRTAILRQRRDTRRRRPHHHHHHHHHHRRH